MGFPPRKTPQFGSTKDRWMRIPLQRGKTDYISGEHSSHKFIGKRAFVLWAVNFSVWSRSGWQKKMIMLDLLYHCLLKLELLKGGVFDKAHLGLIF